MRFHTHADPFFKSSADNFKKYAQKETGRARPNFYSSYEINKWRNIFSGLHEFYESTKNNQMVRTEKGDLARCQIWPKTQVSELVESSIVPNSHILPSHVWKM